MNLSSDSSLPSATRLGILILATLCGLVAAAAVSALQTGGFDFGVTLGAAFAALLAAGTGIYGYRYCQQRRQALEMQVGGAIEMATECISVLATDGTVQRLNRAGLKIVEAASPTEVIGRPAVEWVLPAYRPAFLEFVGQVMAGLTLDHEIEIKGLRGTVRRMDIHAAPLRDAAGKVSGMICVARDVTEIRRNEAALREGKTFLTELLRTLPDLVWLKNTEGVYLFCNPMFERFFGQPVAKIVGRTDYDFVDKELADFFREHDRNAIAANLPSVNEEWITMADDGRRVLVETTKTPMRGENGELIGVLGIAHDITARKRTEEKLRASEQNLLQAQEIANLGFFILDIGTGIFTSTPILDRIFGFGPDYPHTVDGWLACVAPEHRAAAQAYLLDVVATRQPFDYEYPIIRPGESEIRWVQARGEVEYDAVGTPVRMVGTALDITQRKYFEKELSAYNQRLEEKVAERTASLEAALEGLQRSQEQLARSEARATLSTLIASVSHELNSPVGTSVLMATTLAELARQFQEEFERGEVKRSDLTKFLDDVRQGTELVDRNLQRADELLQKFRQVSADQASEQRRQFDLANMVRDIVGTLAPSLKRQPNRVEIGIPAGIELDSYPGPLGQVTINLINNAFLHAFDDRVDGLLKIEAQVSGDRVTLRFCDNGCGIDHEHMDKLFQPFFSTKIGRGGTGLGMSIVDNLVKKILGGDLSVSSAPGAGTTVEISLPLKAPQEVTARS